MFLHNRLSISLCLGTADCMSLMVLIQTEWFPPSRNNLQEFWIKYLSKSNRFIWQKWLFALLLFSLHIQSSIDLFVPAKVILKHLSNSFPVLQSFCLVLMLRDIQLFVRQSSRFSPFSTIIVNSILFIAPTFKYKTKVYYFLISSLVITRGSL